jgi:NAD+ diphosphatase
LWQVQPVLIPLCYTGCRLDRDGGLRRDGRWIAQRLADPRSRVIPFWREHNLFQIRAAADGTPRQPLAVAGAAAAAAVGAAEQVVLLGVDDKGTAWFAADLTGWEAGALEALGEGAALAELRRMSPLLAAADAALLAYGRGMLQWHRRHRFCGVCGGSTASRHGGHLRVCGRDGCGAEHFPRTDPAVIMLVTRPGGGGGACLLGRQARWPAGMFSTLAGFVEPGESLEEAVAREVREEAGVTVANIRYRGSQPWPFPSSLMLGFRAEAAADARISFDAEELEDARWFSREDLARFRQLGLRLPRADSIARALIEEWIAAGEPASVANEALSSGK